MTTPPRRAYFRRIVGMLVCALPLLAVAASAAYGFSAGNPSRPFGLAVMIAAALVGALNFHLSFIRPALHRIRRGSMEEFEFVSGVPLFGTVLVLAGTLLGFGSLTCAALGLVALALDTGGAPWFMCSTWRDTSFWDP